MKKIFFLMFYMIFLFTACSDSPPSKLRNASAGILMGEAITTWNDNEVSPQSFYDGLSGENKKWVKEKEGMWYIQEVHNGKILKHYFVQNGSSIHMVYVKVNIDGKDYSPLGISQYGGTNSNVGEGTTGTTLGPMFPLEAFIIKLSDSGGKNSIKVAMEFELENRQLEGEFKNKIPQIKEYIMTVLSSKKMDEVITAEGKFKLKEEIMAKINQNLKDGVVKNVFFTDFEVQ